MEMVFEDDVAVNGEALVVDQVFPGVENDLDGFGASEDGERADDRAGAEVRTEVFEDAIAAAGHSVAPWGYVRGKPRQGQERRRASGPCVPTQSLGTRNCKPQSNRTRIRLSLCSPL